MYSYQTVTRFTEGTTSTFATVKHLSLRPNNHVTQTESRMREDCDRKLNVLSVSLKMSNKEKHLKTVSYLFQLKVIGGGV